MIQCKLWTIWQSVMQAILVSCAKTSAVQTVRILFHATTWPGHVTEDAKMAGRGSDVRTVCILYRWTSHLFFSKNYFVLTFSFDYAMRFKKKINVCVILFGILFSKILFVLLKVHMFFFVKFILPSFKRNVYFL